jgi:DNA-binding CsgD family transcriptional regulator
VVVKGVGTGAQLIQRNLIEIIGSLGTGDFGSSLLSAASESLGARHLSIFIFDERLVPRVASAASLDGSDLASRAGEEFVRLALYKDDPLVSVVNRKSGDGRPLVQRSTPVAADQKKFYLSLGLTERVTILDRARSGWLSINFYRTNKSAPLSPAAMDGFVADASLLHTLASKHIELIRHRAPEHDATGYLRQCLKQLCASLTERETDVCVLALQGNKNTEIASALGIEPSTVSTLRHRAYDRLQVSNLVEIFLKCLVLPR